MPLFVCRWPNGDFSAASARSKEEAIQLLAEIGNAETCEVFATDNFMLHFHLKEQVDDFEDMLPVRFSGFGEQTHRMLCERMYPTYCSAIAEIDKDRPQVTEVAKERFNAAWELLNKALSTERTRNLAQPPDRVADSQKSGLQQS